jgi:Spy/CpxP family protein refolding chaperone
MTPFTRRIISAALLTALASLAGVSMAETGKDSPREGRMGSCHPGDRAGFMQRMEKHQQALHDKLKLSAEQESAWKTWRDALKAARPDAARFNPEEMQKLTAPERADRMQKMHEERSEGMRRASDAMKALYATLDAGQQKLFDENQFPRFGKGKDKAKTSP